MAPILRSSGCIVRCVLALVLSAALNSTRAEAFGVLYAFEGGSDGYRPRAGLIMDTAGDLYGTTSQGGSTECGGFGCGTVFKLSADGTETVLHAFTGGDGVVPDAGVIVGKRGNLFGTTSAGGANNDGTVFEVATDGTETVLHSFKGKTDGAIPEGGLIKDDSGNLYGTTLEGGANSLGVVFRLAPNGTLKVLHAFAGGSDGAAPFAGLVADNSGNLYGTTYEGGDGGYGTVFQLTSDGTETVVHAFTGGSDGAYPHSGSLIIDKTGNLYGTTLNGGGSSACAYGCGTVFEVAPNGIETVLYTFTGANGAFPESSLLLDKKGNLYGTTSYGGVHGRGIVFKLAPDATETVLHSFKGGSGGAYPLSGLIADSANNLYGTTFQGGAYKSGTIFSLKK